MIVGAGAGGSRVPSSPTETARFTSRGEVGRAAVRPAARGRGGPRPGAPSRGRPPRFLCETSTRLVRRAVKAGLAHGGQQPRCDHATAPWYSCMSPPRGSRRRTSPEVHLRRARKRLAESGSLWWNPAIPDRLREEALHEIFTKVDVKGSQLLAVHPQPNENSWLLGLAALRQEQHVGMVGARGVASRLCGLSSVLRRDAPCAPRPTPADARETRPERHLPHAGDAGVVDRMWGTERLVLVVAAGCSRVRAMASAPRMPGTSV